MKMIQSSKYIIQSASVYSGGAIMTSGPDYGKSFDGGIIAAQPLPGAIMYEQPFSQMNWGYSGFLNLNNCSHKKIDGCMIASSTPINAYTRYNSLFGPAFQIGDGGLSGTFNLMIPPGGSSFLYKASVGSYNRAPEGTWYFGIGAMYVGSTILLSCIGQADNKSLGSGGVYGMYADEVITHNGYYERRQAYFTTSIRTSSMRPLDLISLCREKILSDLDKKAYISSSYTSINSISGLMYTPSLSSLNNVAFDSLFPSQDRNPDWSSLASAAYNSVPFNSSNGIAFAGDLVGMKAAVTSTSKLLSELLFKNASAKIIAKLFLAFYYGWRLLALDCRGFAKSLRKSNSLSSNNCKCSSNLTWTVRDSLYNSHFHCYYIRDYHLITLLDRFVSFFDFELTLENIWDLIPMSFVIDWFMQVGDLCDSLDNYRRITQEHKIICTGRSIKCQLTRSSTQSGLRGWIGVATYTLYTREYTDIICNPSLTLGTINQSFHHLVEGSALIVSRR